MNPGRCLLCVGGVLGNLCLHLIFKTAQFAADTVILSPDAWLRLGGVTEWPAATWLVGDSLALPADALCAGEGSGDSGPVTEVGTVCTAPRGWAVVYDSFVKLAVIGNLQDLRAPR